MLGEIGDSWDDFRSTPDEFIEDGDTVVVLGHNEARAKQSGDQIKVPFVHVWRMSGGKVSRVRSSPTPRWWHARWASARRARTDRGSHRAPRPAYPQPVLLPQLEHV